MAVDRRVERTRRALHEALMALVAERDYDEITVQQLLDRADVGRSTFYSHYRDKDEVLMSGVHRLRDMLTTAQQQRRVAGKAAENVIAFSGAMFEHASQTRKLYRALVSSQVWPHVRQRIQNILTELIRAECRPEVAQLKASGSDVPVELFVQYVASTFMSVMSWWMDRKPGLAAGEVNEIFRALVLPTTKALLR